MVICLYAYIVYVLLTTYCLLLTTDHLLFTAYYLLLMGILRSEEGPKASKLRARGVIWSFTGGVLGPFGLHFGVLGGPKVSKMRARGAIGALNGGVLGPLGPQGRKSSP